MGSESQIHFAHASFLAKAFQLSVIVGISTPIPLVEIMPKPPSGKGKNSETALLSVEPDPERGPELHDNPEPGGCCNLIRIRFI